MKSLQLLCIILGCCCALNAQKINLKGTVVDTLNAPLSGATVMLLQAKDSVLVKFGITSDKGRFEMEKVSPDDYILQITYLGYANLSQPITVGKDVKENDLGVLQLAPESALLNEIEVRADYVPIKMKKDTIEYNAAAFQTKPNAAVEDLLKKLPGVEVDRSGNIKAQGENVQKVLVDGKEFFGDDPKIATKNLPADAVDKVQVFDKKSDIAEFSGVDDGREAKTINLSLKEDKKKGYFGRIKGGYGSDERYENKFNINRFGSNVQFSTLGMFNNVNEQGFSINDYINMMGGLNNLLSGGGGAFSLDGEELGLPLDMGQKNQGFTTTSAGGINLNWELSKKTKLHTSYFYNGIKRTYAIEENTESLLGDKSFNSTRNSTANRKNKGHRLNLNLNSKIDSFQTIKWRTNLGITQRDNSSNSFAQTYNLSNELENSSDQQTATDMDNFSWNSNLTYLRRFKKKGRFFTTNVAFERRNQIQEKSVIAQNRFFTNPILNDSIVQRQESENLQTNYGINLTYTEPVGKSKYLELNYSFQNYSNDLERNFYDLKEQQAFFNADLSNHFIRDYLYHRAGLNYKWTSKKWRFNAGFNAQNSVLKGDLLLNDIQIEKDFFNLLPKVNFNYDFKATRSIRFDYRTRVREPSLEQLQPIVDNSNPLSIYIGNPDLRPEYSHNFRLNFNSFDQFSSISVFASINADFTNYKILNSRRLDEQFRQTVRPVNFGDDSRIDGYLSYGMPVKFLKSRISLSADYEQYKGNYLVNEIANQFTTRNAGLDINLTNRNTEKVELVLGYKWSKNNVNYSGENTQNQAYTDELFYTDVEWHITNNWTINSTLDYTRYSNASFGAATDIAIWQAGIAYNFLKNKRGTLKLTANDILNQNLGLNRISQLNFLQEQRIASLGRYYMLSFTYALSGFGNQGDVIQVTRRR